MALSTATFAWYTANNSANATAAKITATTADGNLEISLDGTEGSWSTGVTFVENTTPIKPMMPTSDDITTTTWYTATKSSDGTITYATAGDPRSYTFHLRNLNSDALELDFTVTADDQSNSASLRYAIVIGGSVVEATAFDYLTATTAGATDATANVAAVNGSYEIAQNATDVVATVYLWYNGATMLNNDGGSVSSINIAITKKA